MLVQSDLLTIETMIWFDYPCTAALAGGRSRDEIDASSSLEWTIQPPQPILQPTTLPGSSLSTTTVVIPHLATIETMIWFDYPCTAALTEWRGRDEIDASSSLEWTIQPPQPILQPTISCIPSLSTINAVLPHLVAIQGAKVQFMGRGGFGVVWCVCVRRRRRGAFATTPTHQIAHPVI